MNYQIYRLKRKMQRWLYSVEDIIYFPTRELFDRSPALQQWIKDRDKKKIHKRKIMMLKDWSYKGYMKTDTKCIL